MLLKSLQYLLLPLFSMLCSPVIQAATSTYFSLTPGYLDIGIDGAKADGASGKFAWGYQLHRQWFLELNYQYLGKQKSLAGTAFPVNSNELEPGFEGQALGIGLLGKAENRVGMLFYRLGIMATDVDYQVVEQSVAGARCQSVSLQDGLFDLCDRSNTGIAAVIGLGFDYAVADNWYVRLEVEHIEGQDDLQGDGVFLGVRYSY